MSGVFCNASLSCALAAHGLSRDPFLSPDRIRTHRSDGPSRVNVNGRTCSKGFRLPSTDRSHTHRSSDHEGSEDIDQDIDEERDEACATPVSSAQIDVHEKNPLKNGVKTRKDSHEGARRL
jgi:hypothetical protein